MSKSIMQDEKACYITGRTDHLHKHHIFGGGRRKISEKWGLWIWLTGGIPQPFGSRHPL